MSEEDPSRSGLEEALRAPVRAALDGPSRLVTTAVAERVAEILIEDGAIERIVERAINDPSTERAAVAVLDSELLDELTQRLIASDELQQLIEHITTSPEVRSAITSQGAGFLDDLRLALVKQARNADAIVETPLRSLRRKPRREEPVANAGIICRLIALTLDAVLVNVVLLGISTLVALLFSAVSGHNPDALVAALAGVTAWIVAANLYLASFWSLTGQTPGMRFMSIELRGSDGNFISFGRGIRRVIGMVLAAIPFFAGYLPIMTNDRRRGFQDRVADTVVRYTEDARH